MQTLEKLRLLFESFHEAIYIVDTERKILYFNPAASQIRALKKQRWSILFVLIIV